METRRLPVSLTAFVAFVAAATLTFVILTVLTGEPEPAPMVVETTGNLALSIASQAFETGTPVNEIETFVNRVEGENSSEVVNDTLLFTVYDGSLCFFGAATLMDTDRVVAATNATDCSTRTNKFGPVTGPFPTTLRFVATKSEKSTSLDSLPSSCMRCETKQWSLSA